MFEDYIQKSTKPVQESKESQSYFTLAKNILNQQIKIHINGLWGTSNSHKKEEQQQ